MKITDFTELIKNLPYEYQSFDIKTSAWKKVKSQKWLTDKIFEKEGKLNEKGDRVVILNRTDLMNPNLEIKEFIIKVLMWGYPTMGRGRNIENLLKEESFRKLIDCLNLYQEEQNITIKKLRGDIKDIEGLGISTMTKFIYFLNIEVENQNALILDLQVINAINLGRFEDLSTLKGISYENALKSKYLEYLKVLSELSTKMNCKPDQIEMFLFMFGKNLSEIKN